VLAAVRHTDGTCDSYVLVRPRSAATPVGDMALTRSGAQAPWKRGPAVLQFRIGNRYPPMTESLALDSLPHYTPPSV